MSKLKDKVKELFTREPRTTLEEAEYLLGISPTTIKKYRLELGLVTKRTRLTKAQHEQIALLRESGLSYGQIADELGIKSNTVAIILTRRNCHKTALVEKGIPVTELYEKSPVNRMITCAWTRANVKTIFQGAQ